MLRNKHFLNITAYFLIIILLTLLPVSHSFANEAGAVREGSSTHDETATAGDPVPGTVLTDTVTAGCRAANVPGNAPYLTSTETDADGSPVPPSHIPVDAPDVSSTSAVVMDVDTGEILYEKNPFDVRYPASTTKLMTGLLTLENASLTDTVTVNADDISSVPQGYVSIYLQDGETLSVESALYALLIYSANDSAFALAHTVGGSYSAFYDMMNSRAGELGCISTHFANPNGIDNPSHYTCAYDLALIGCEAYKNPEFRKITSSLTYTIPATNRVKEPRQINNINLMLSPSSGFYYEYATGGKTGYTGLANGTYVAYAERDGMRLCCALMNCDPKENRFLDAAKLFDYCFDTYSIYTPLLSFNLGDSLKTTGSYIMNTYSISSSISFEGYTVDRSAGVIVRNNADTSPFGTRAEFTRPDGNGGAGSVIITYGGNDICRADIYANNISEKIYINATEGDAKKGSAKKHISNAFSWLGSHIGMILLPFIAAGIIFAAFKYKKLQDERRRKRRRKAPPVRKD